MSKFTDALCMFYLILLISYRLLDGTHTFSLFPPTLSLPRWINALKPV